MGRKSTVNKRLKRDINREALRGKRHPNPLEADLLTDNEWKFLEVLQRFKQLKATATTLGIGYRTAQRIKKNITTKWVRGINTNNRIIAFCRGDQPLKKLLLPVVHEVPPLEEMPTEEEW